ncbi:MAG TPA: hypothetical protein VEA80_17950 [Vitreimonas sp.]|uniref:hypothetical protein n=1 Tax=Vitreimonas sp. TaxID=3069702 RepID=UPI002D6164C6|nr:hypothetical protein [Vitreimonas sp.]HYD89368.1 hypothetical protein [Vitreimonas sp.]
MPRNFIVYGLAALAGVMGYFVLRGLLGGELMLLVGLIGLVVVGVIMFRNLRTNRKVAEATPEQRTQALAFTPDVGKAALYLFRNQFVGRAVGVNVLIDGREVAQLKSPRFTRILLAPGAHRIAGYTGTNKRPEDGEGLAFTANAGDVLVMKCEVEAQMVGVTVKFTPLALDAARADVGKIARMVTPDVAEI